MSSSSEAVKSALCQRIRVSRLDLITTYGIERVMDAVNEKAEWMGELEEIGSSDVSCWLMDIEATLERQKNAPQL